MGPEMTNFIDLVKAELRGLLSSTVWGKVNGVEERSEALIDLQYPYVKLAFAKNYSSRDVAESLFNYEKVQLGIS